MSLHMEGTGGTREAEVARHYGVENLEEKILGAFEAAGKPRNSLTLGDLAGIDEFHVGGREATEALAAQLPLRSGMKLLDIGAGIGGPARYFASQHGCDVTGVDLTAEFVRTARALTSRVAPHVAIRFEQASALELPFAPESFDGAYLFHVGMNIADKRKLFEESRRVLCGGGWLAMFEMMRAGEGELGFPVPWASSSAESFVATAAEYQQALAGAGFTITAQRDRRQFAIEFLERTLARNQQPGPKPLGVSFLMGETAPLKMKNVMEGMQRVLISPVEMIAGG
jgi:ubiquinone/menaquinone biosynthesis C-methylase UbiE